MIGWSIHKDYGLSWDEETYRLKNGKVVYDYIVNGEVDSLLNGAGKYHVMLLGVRHRAAVNVPHP